MSRCFCPCHTSPGVYPPPCGVCGHDTREGRFPGTSYEGWEPNEPKRMTRQEWQTLKVQDFERMEYTLAAYELALRAIAAADESEHNTHQDCPGAVATEALKAGQKIMSGRAER